MGAFQGLATPSDSLAIDEAALRAWVGHRLPGFDRPVSAMKFNGGQSNPTYCIATEATRYVLRRRPPGVGASTAHAVDREFRVLKALQGSDLPIPRPLLYCADDDVIGSAFYLVEYVEGRVFWDPQIPELARDERRQLYDHANSCLASLHKIDLDAVGLSDFGRSGGYTRRNFERWWKTYQASKAVDIPDMEWLADQLRQRIPPSEPVTLIHGDFGIYNLIADPVAPRVAAIIDWEMATIGNPLVDLAHNMRPWVAPPAGDGSVPTLSDKDLGEFGLPTLEAYAGQWSQRTGIAWTDGDFYLSYAIFRHAAMIQGVLKRFADGTAANRTAPYKQNRVAELAATARAILSDGIASLGRGTGR